MQCIVCGNFGDNKAFKIREMMFGTREEFDYLECGSCGCLFMIEPPEDMIRFYDHEIYYSFNFRELNFFQKFIQRKRNEYCLFKKGFIGRIINKKLPNTNLESLRIADVHKKAKILDVGCGQGHLLYSLNDLKFKKLVGIDPYLKKEFMSENLKILKKSIFDMPNDSKYDLIMFNHSFEHMIDQIDVLNKVSRILSEDGICMIRIPIKSEYIWKKYGINWVQIDAPRHLLIHTLKSFNKIINKTSLKIKKIIFDSTEFQFWVSEQYKNDIPYYSNRSYRNNPKNSIFTKKQIENFKIKSNELNKNKLGDQATIILIGNQEF